MPDSDGGWAWLVVLGSFISTIISGLFCYSTGIFHLALLDKFGDSITKTAWVGSLFASLFSIGGPLASVLIERFSCRVAMMIAGVFYTVGFVTTAFATSLDQCILTFGVIAGIGGGVSFNTAQIVVGYNFRRKLNVASALAISGAGVGIFGLSPAIQTIRDVYGFTGFYLLVGAIASHIFVVGALYRPSKFEKEKRILLQRRAGKSKIKSLIDFINRYIRVYSKKSLVCFCLSFFFYAFGTYLVFYHLPSFCIKTGRTPLEASWVMSASGIGTLVGRLMVGFAANNDQVDEFTIYLSTMGILGIATILVPQFAHSLGSQIVYAAFLGMYSCGFFSVINAIVIRIAGLNDLSLGFGFILFFCGLGQLTGPVAAGKLIEEGFSYQQTFAVAGLCHLMSSLIGMFTTFFETESSFVKGTIQERKDIEVKISTVKLENKMNEENICNASNTEEEEGKPLTFGDNKNTEDDVVLSV